MATTMQAWVLTAKRKMELQERPIPQLRDNEVLVRIKAAGICGSDLQFYKNGKIGIYEVDGPLILGHECSGEVVALGKNVTRVKEGDRVAIEPGISCGKCWYCKKGKYNLCQEMQFMGTPPTDGCFCEYVAWPDDLLFKLPEKTSYLEGALIEPFVVGMQGLRQSGFEFTSSAVVLGCGTIGLMMIQALRVAGAGTIIGIGRSDNKLELARKVGATHTLKSTPDVADRVKELTDGLGAMYGYEAVGTDATYAQMASLVRDGGMICFLGLLADDGTPMPMATSAIRELRYSSVIRYTNLFHEATVWMDQGLVDLMPILSAQYPFAETDIACEEALTGKAGTIKIAITF